MAQPVKTISLIFLVYFILLALYGLACFIKYTIDVNEYGGEMGDTIFLFFLFLATGYYGLFLLWTVKIYKQPQIISNAYFQLALIFLLGICSSLYILGIIYLNL
jgi:uncharacterized membrane protein